MNQIKCQLKNKCACDPSLLCSQCIAVSTASSTEMMSSRVGRSPSAVILIRACTHRLSALVRHLKRASRSKDRCRDRFARPRSLRACSVTLQETKRPRGKYGMCLTIKLIWYRFLVTDRLDRAATHQWLRRRTLSWCTTRLSAATLAEEGLA